MYLLWLCMCIVPVYGAEQGVLLLGLPACSSCEGVWQTTATKAYASVLCCCFCCVCCWVRLLLQVLLGSAASLSARDRRGRAALDYAPAGVQGTGHRAQSSEAAAAYRLLLCVWYALAQPLLQECCNAFTYIFM